LQPPQALHACTDAGTCYNCIDAAFAKLFLHREQIAETERSHNIGGKAHCEAWTMTTVQITLPDDLAREAANAGLLSAEAIEAMLREQLRRQAGGMLQAMWLRGPREELTPELEQEIVEEVRKARAERRTIGTR